MTLFKHCGLPLLVMAGVVLGCAPTPTTHTASTAKAEAKPATSEEEADIKANLAKLSPADRKLAEEQKYCVIEDDTRLGSMDVPEKVMVKGQPVFLCCGGCKKKALADPDKTLAKVKELKAKAAAEAKK